LKPDAMTLKMLNEALTSFLNFKIGFELNKQFYLVQEAQEGYPISKLILDTERLPSWVINIL